MYKRQEQARIGGEGRDGGRLGDFDVGDVDVFGDDERRRAQDVYKRQAGSLSPMI